MSITNWLPTEDLCIDIYTPGSEGQYEWPKELKPKRGELPEYYAEQARRYIAVVTETYPFQMRWFLGEPMWMRFCDMWADKGDFTRSMRAI